MPKRKQRKASTDRKEARLLLRLADDQQRWLEEAAAKANLDLSSWMRIVALRPPNWIPPRTDHYVGAIGVGIA